MGRVLVGSRVELHPLEPSMFEEYLKAFSEAVRLYIGVDLESERIYIESHYQKRLIGETVFFVFFHKGTKALMGAIEIRPEHYRGQLYYWLNEYFWSKGFLQEGLSLILSYYHLSTQKKSVTAFIDVSNILSIKALQRFGFQKGDRVKGAREDQIIMTYFL